MHLKTSINFPTFLKQVKLCKNNVTFETSEGDCLNLKSMLSSYIFVTLVQNPELLSSGQIVCQNINDYSLLQEYLEDDPQKK